MPLINLIHEQRLAARRSDRKSKTLFLTFVGAMLAGAGGFVVGSFEADRLHDEEASLQAQIERAKPLIAKTEENLRLTADLTPRLNTLEDAQKTTERWGRVLSYLTTQTPPQAGLTAIRCQGADPKRPIMVSFGGVALAQEPVGELILRLQNSDDLSNLTLKFTQEKLIDQAKATEFLVEADLAGTEPKKSLEEEAK